MDRPLEGNTIIVTGGALRIGWAARSSHVTLSVVRAQMRLVEGTMNLVTPQLARGELDIVVGHSAPENADPQIEAEILYVEPIRFLCRPQYPWVKQRWLKWADLLACQWIVWLRAVFETALAAAGQTMPCGMAREIP